MATRAEASSAKPRLCFVVTSHISAVTFLKGYLSHLSRDWDVVLVCAPHPDLESFARREGVTLRTIAMARQPSPFRDLVSLVRLIRALSRLRPTAVVYATPKASLLASVAAWLVRVPARIYEVWGLRLETSQGMSYRLFWAMERISMALSTRIVANSRSLASRAAELGLAGSKRVDVLGAGSSHGVDTAWFSRTGQLPPIDPATESFLKSSDGLTVGFIGRLHPDKGIDTLLSALEICADRGTTLRGLLVGGEDGMDPAEIVRRGRRAKIETHLTGAVSDPRPYLAQMDVLVLLSLREGFPNVVLEAAAMGVPAIVSNATGTVDSVEDGITGQIVEVDDALSVAHVLAELAEDPERRLAMGSAARSRVERLYSQQDIWMLHEQYFAEAAASTTGDRTRT